MIKALVLVASTLALAACNSKRQDMASCDVEATKVYPHLEPAR